MTRSIDEGGPGGVSWVLGVPLPAYTQCAQPGDSLVTHPAY